MGHLLAPGAGIDLSGVGIDLSGATRLSFCARGEAGNEVVDFFLAGVGRHYLTGAPIEPYPDSSPRLPPFGPTFPLTTQWQRYEINTQSADLHYVLGGFG